MRQSSFTSNKTKLRKRGNNIEWWQLAKQHGWIPGPSGRHPSFPPLTNLLGHWSYSMALCSEYQAKGARRTVVQIHHISGQILEQWWFRFPMDLHAVCHLFQAFKEKSLPSGARGEATNYPETSSSLGSKGYWPDREGCAGRGLVWHIWDELNQISQATSAELTPQQKPHMWQDWPWRLLKSGSVRSPTNWTEGTTGSGKRNPVNNQTCKQGIWKASR